MTYISQILATKCICSRKEAIQYIKKGLVLVDNDVVFQDSLIDSNISNVILAERAKLIQENKLSIVLNKPIGYLSVPTDSTSITKYSFNLLTPQNRYFQPNYPIRYKNLIPNKLKDLKSIHHLQGHISGLSLFSQDGRLSNLRLDQEYISTVEQEVTEENLLILKSRQYISGILVPPFEVRLLDSNKLSFILTDILPNQIVKVCQFAGLTVRGIRRVRLGNIHLGSLPLGKWRVLDHFEL